MKLDEAIEALLDSLAAYADSSPGALALRELAEAGQDIQRAVPALMKTLQEANQIGLLGEAGDALARHWCNQGAGDAMVAAFRQLPETTYLAEGVERLAKTGHDVGPLVDALIRPRDQMPKGLDVVRLLQAHVGDDPERLADVVTRLLPVDVDRAARLWRELLLWDRGQVDVGPSLAQLGPALAAAKGDDVEPLLRVASLAAEEGLDLGEARPVLERLARRKPAKRREAAAYALGMDAIRRGDWAGLDAILGGRAAPLRKAGARALVVAAKSRGLRGPAHVARLGATLVDAEGEVRAAVRECFRHLAGEGVAVELPPETLAAWRGLAPDHPARADVVELLHVLGVDAAEGEPCAACLALPLTGSWSIHRQMPAEARALVGDGEVRRCPTCQAPYRVEVEIEDRGLYPEEYWNVRKLSPAEAARTLGGRDRKALGARRDEARVLLGHPLRAARRHAAWVLAEGAGYDQDPDALGALLASPDEDVVLVTMDAITALQVRGVEVQLPMASIEAALAGDDPAAQARAATIWARRTLRAGRWAALRQRLGELGDDARAAALRALTDEARGGTSMGRLAGDLAVYLDHDHEATRRAAYQVLARGKQTAAVTRCRWEVTLQQLASPDPKRFAEGARHMIDLVHARRLEPVLDLLEPRLSDPSVLWDAHHALDRLLRKGFDCDRLLPAFFAALDDEALWGKASFGDTFYPLHERWGELDRYAGTLVRCLGAEDGNLVEAAFIALEEMSDRGGDLAPHAEDLWARRKGMEGYQRERLGKMLARVYLPAGDWRRLRRTLADGGFTIAWGAADVVRAAAERGEDMGEVAPALAKGLSSRSAIHRQHVDGALRAVLKAAPHATPATQRALRKVPESPELEGLRAWMERPSA